jgi:hypothetical protein
MRCLLSVALAQQLRLLPSAVRHDEGVADLARACYDNHIAYASHSTFARKSADADE